jgi:hypothetical protein
MPFGLTNASGMVEHFVNDTVERLDWQAELETMPRLRDSERLQVVGGDRRSSGSSPGDFVEGIYSPP